MGFGVCEIFPHSHAWPSLKIHFLIGAVSLSQFPEHTDSKTIRCFKYNVHYKFLLVSIPDAQYTATVLFLIPKVQ